jgi:hypothetical protein
MFRRRTGVHAATVAAAALVSVAIPIVAGVVPSGASGVGSPPDRSADHTPPVLVARLPTTTALPSKNLERPPVSLPRISVPPIYTPGPPDAPGLYPLQASQYDVVVRWYDRSDNENSFIVWRLDGQGNWQNVYEVPTYNQAGAGEGYSWTDTDTDQSGQCYMIAAVDAAGAGDSPVECTVRPDPSQFPQVTSLPPGTPQWYGLSGYNDGTGPLQTGVRDDNTNLIWSNETFGVNLAWTDKPSLWKIQATGGPNAMYGEAVALRVWGGGWLEYGHETWGVDLELSSTPVYQWYVLGETPGNTVDSAEFALWNSAASDFLVEGHQTWGVDLNWYKKTLPYTPPPTPTAPGVRLLVEYNCSMDGDPVEMWVDDFTTRTGWSDEGTVQPGWVDGEGCGQTSGDIWSFSPISGHSYEVRAVDFDGDGCSNDPTISSCDIADVSFVGDPNGNVVTIPIG